MLSKPSGVSVRASPSMQVFVVSERGRTHYPLCGQTCTVSHSPLWVCCIQAHSVRSWGLCRMDREVQQLWIQRSADGDAALGGHVCLISGEDVVEGAGEENGRRSRSFFSRDDVCFNQY